MEFEKALGFVFEWLLRLRVEDLPKLFRAFCRKFSLNLKRGMGKIDILTTIRSTK
jgi:hypothetical protein